MSERPKTITFVRPTPCTGVGCAGEAVDSDHQPRSCPQPRPVNDYQARTAAHLAKVADLAPQLPGDAVISHESAALVFGLPTYDVPAAVRVTRGRGRSVRTSDVHVIRAELRPWDRTSIRDIPVTSPARTVVDLGRRLPFGQALVTADAAL